MKKRTKNKVVKEELLKGDVNPDLCLHDDHDFPMTRRELLSAGIISGATTLALPTLGAFFSNISKAQGQDIIKCSSGNFTPEVPVYFIEGAGGMNILGNNVLAGLNDNGSTLDGYSNLRVGDLSNAGVSINAHPSDPRFVSEWGGLHWHAYSMILQGIQDAIANATDATGAAITVGTDSIEEHTMGVVCCIRSNDDTATNPHNYINLPYQLNNNGAQLTYGVFNGSTRSLKQPGADPVLANVQGGAGSLLDMGKMQRDLKSGNTEQKLADAMNVFKNITDSYTKNVLEKSDAYRGLAYIQEKKKNIFCASDKAPELFSKFSAAALAPNDLTGIYPDAATSRDAQAINLIARQQGIVQVGGQTIGGCDYHNNGVVRNSGKDLEVGRAIGRALATFALRNVKGVIHLFTDGGVQSNGQEVEFAHPGLGEDVPKTMFTGDFGALGAQLTFYFDPNRKRSEFSANQGNQYGNIHIVGNNRQTRSNERSEASNFKNAGLFLLHNYDAFSNDGDNTRAEKVGTVAKNMLKVK